MCFCGGIVERQVCGQGVIDAAHAFLFELTKTDVLSQMIYIYVCVGLIEVQVF